MMERVTSLDQRTMTLAKKLNLLGTLVKHVGCTNPAPPMKQHGVGIVNRLGAQGGCTETVVGISERTGQSLVESVQAVEDIGSREHARGRDGRNVTAGQQAPVWSRVPTRNPVPECRSAKRVVDEPVLSDDQSRVMHDFFRTQKQCANGTNIGPLSIC